MNIMRKKILVAIATLISLTSWAVTTVESQPGKLESLLTDHSITSLKVTGTIDARDFKFIADNLLALSEIDLSEVTIAAYCNEETATFGADNNFAAASIPCTSFFGKSITSVVLPASVKSIGFAAFAGCDQLTTIAFPASLNSISGYAFSGSGLTSVELPASVKTVGEGAFARCENLASATVGSENIGKDAFYADAALAALTLNKEVKTIGDGAFKSCAALTGINIEGTALESIGDEAFAYTSISALDLSAQKSLKTVGGWALAKTPISTATLPNSVNTMGEGTFFYAAQLENTNLPDSLTTVPAFTFAGAEALVGESIVPATATEMGDFSFYNACAMPNFTIPKSINRIGTKAMAGMTGLDTIKAHSDAVPALGDSVWAGIDQPSVKLGLTNMALAEDFAHAAQWEHFHILKNYLLGDVNGDGNLDVADATLLISYILGENPNPFHLELANIIDDGVIDVTDVSALINMILSGDQIIIRRAPVTPHTTTLR